MAKKKTETANNLEMEKVAVVNEEATTNNTEPVVLDEPKTLMETTTDFDVEKVRKKQRAATITKNVFVYFFLTVCAIFAFLPFYWMIISSVKTETEYREAVPPTFFPHTFMWKNYSAVLAQTDTAGSNFWQILLNTLVVGFLSTTIGVIVTIITAYALARMNFKGKNVLFSLMLATMMIPGEMYTLTNYITITGWKWQNTFTVLIVPFLVSVYYIYLLRNNFMQIPNSLYQAAKVDGLSDMGYLIKVMVPLTAPTLVSITLLKFIGSWNSYIWPRLVNGTNWQMITNWVTRGFYDKQINGSFLYPDPSGVGSAYMAEPLTTLRMAAVCIVSAPLFILFIFCRKYIMHGVSKSGTKG